VPAGAECHEPALTIDLLPTVARLAGAALPKRPIDGLDIWPLLSGQPGAKGPHDALYFYWLTELHAVRAGRWKLHLVHPYPHVAAPGKDGRPGKVEQHKIGQELFDLEADIAESKNVAAENPQVVDQLLVFAERARKDLGDTLTGRAGRNLRQPGQLAAAP
jgi:arylsulfatase A-like enzyme